MVGLFRISNCIQDLALLDLIEQKKVIRKFSKKEIHFLFPLIKDAALKKIIVQGHPDLNRNDRIFQSKKLSRVQARTLETQIANKILVATKKEKPEKKISFIQQIQELLKQLILNFFNLFEANTEAFFKEQPKIGHPEGKWLEVSQQETQEIIDGLVKETEDKVTAEITFSPSHFGLTIGELVKKNGGAELFYLGSGADGCFADEIEWNTLQKIKNNLDEFSEAERKIFVYYCKSVEVCRDINQALDAYWTRVENLSADLETPKVVNVDEKRKQLQQLAKIPYALANEIFDRLGNLAVGEAISLNIGHYNHGMQMSFKKTEQGYDITLYDSGSGLEFMFLSKGILSKTRLLNFYHAGYPAHCGISLKVTHQKFTELGKDYLKNLIIRSCVNYDEKVLHAPIEKNIKDLEKQIARLPKSNIFAKAFLALKIKLLNLQEVLLWGNKWERTVKIFGSISPDTMKLIPELLAAQWIGNCTAKRLRAIQRKEMGYSLYQKMNAHLHEDVKTFLLKATKEKKYLDEALYEDLLKMKPLTLDPQTLKKASAYLSKFDSFPPHKRENLSKVEQEENHQAITYVTMLINHNIAHSKIPNRVIRTHRNSLIKATKKELHQFRPSLHDLQQVSLVKRFRLDRSVERGVEIDIHGQAREISKLHYFNYVLRNPEYLLDHKVIINLQFLGKDKHMSLREKVLLKKIHELQIKKMSPLRYEMLEEVHNRLTNKLSGLEKDQKRAGNDLLDQLNEAEEVVEILQIRHVLKKIQQAKHYLKEIDSLPQKNIFVLTNSYLTIQENIKHWDRIGK